MIETSTEIRHIEITTLSKAKTWNSSVTHGNMNDKNGAIVRRELPSKEGADIPGQNELSYGAFVSALIKASNLSSLMEQEAAGKLLS